MGLRGPVELDGAEVVEMDRMGTAPVTAAAGRVAELDGREVMEVNGKRVDVEMEFGYPGKRGRRESRWPAKVQPWMGGLPPRLETVYEVDWDCRWPAELEGDMVFPGWLDGGLVRHKRGGMKMLDEMSR